MAEELIGADFEKLESSLGWSDWKQNIEFFLTMNGLGILLPGEPEADGPEPSLVYGSESSTTDKDEDEASQREKLIFQAKEKWRCSQQRGTALIRQNVGYRPRCAIENLSTVSETLKVLERDYTPNVNDVFEVLYDAFYALSLKDCDSIGQYGSKLLELRDRMAKLDKEANLSEPFLIRHFLNGLGDEYSVFRGLWLRNKALLKDSTREPITLIETISYAEGEESRLRATNKTTYLANQTRKHCLWNEGHTKRYSHCKRVENTVPECWRRYPELRIKENGKKKRGGSSAGQRGWNRIKRVKGEGQDWEIAFDLFGETQENIKDRKYTHDEIDSIEL